MIKINAKEQSLEMEGSLPKLMLELYQIIKAFYEDENLSKITKVFLKDIKSYNLSSNTKADEEKDIKRIALLCVAQQVAEKNIKLENEEELKDYVNYTIENMYE